MSKVVVIKTEPETILDDYAKLLDLCDYRQQLGSQTDLLVKINLSWSKFFPASSSPPWQVEGVLKKLLSDGYRREQIIPIENRTVCTDLPTGIRNNKWQPIFEKYGLTFTPLPSVKWGRYIPAGQLLVLDKIFPEGIMIPEFFIGKNIIHLPTVKTHGHSVTTGSIKNAFGGLLKEVRYHCHKYIHETLVDLLVIQKEIHPRIFTAMDGTVCGNGAGPRTMMPEIKNYLLGSFDPVAIDAVASKMMGFDPLKIPYIKMAHQLNLGVGDVSKIELVGEDIRGVNFNFKFRRSLVIWGNQLLVKGPLRFLEYLALHSPLRVWAPAASNIYHDVFWYNFIGRRRLKKFFQTGWGQLFQKY
jgi:hypothetical protein